MNHHIHPLIGTEADPETGPRRSLQSCRSKSSNSKRNRERHACKSGFPLVRELTDSPLVVCECIARHRNLPTRGPRNLLGDILLARNDAWLNARPRALIAFTADNVDIKFPLRLPIQEETHEKLPIEVKRHALCGSLEPYEQARDMQEVMAAIAGYFGGYSSKMQSIGEKETKQLREAAQRKIEEETKDNDARDFQNYVRRLVKDLEMKGTIRTAVESVNLSLYADHSDVLMAECIRTFPTATFPASLLLKREEVETLTVSGASIIAALHHGHGNKARMYIESAVDLMYGFRGSEHAVDLLSPYEMLLHYSMERIHPPSSSNTLSRAAWTEDGVKYREQCQRDDIRPRYELCR
jgi:hypothetical protein